LTTGGEEKWDENGKISLTVSGKVIHSRVFGENIQLTRKISCTAGCNTIVIEDEVENTGFTEQPFMALFHMNFGWPLLNENSFIQAEPHEVVPQGDVAAAGLEQWDKMSLPIPGFAEQVFYHQIPADSDGMMNISLVNPDEKLKLTVSCRRKELPYFVEWKQMGQGEYVLGLEPANCLPENQNNYRAKNTLKTIKPGEIIRLKVMVTIEKFC
jgi:galactose mutarotase-like enzyme